MNNLLIYYMKIPLIEEYSFLFFSNPTRSNTYLSFLPCLRKNMKHQVPLYICECAKQRPKWLQGQERRGSKALNGFVRWGRHPLSGVQHEKLYATFGSRSRRKRQVMTSGNIYALCYKQKLLEECISHYKFFSKRLPGLRSLSCAVLPRFFSLFQASF